MATNWLPTKPTTPAAAISHRLLISAGSNRRWIDSQPTSNALKAIMSTTKSPARSSARPYPYV